MAYPLNGAWVAQYTRLRSAETPRETEPSGPSAGLHARIRRVWTQARGGLRLLMKGEVVRRLVPVCLLALAVTACGGPSATSPTSTPAPATPTVQPQPT